MGQTNIIWLGKEELRFSEEDTIENREYKAPSDVELFITTFFSV